MDCLGNGCRCLSGNYTNMILTILFYIIGFLLDLLTALLPVWQPYPHWLLDACLYLGKSLSLFNFICNPADLAGAGIFLVQVASGILVIKLIISIVSAVRGHKIIDTK